MKNEIKSALEKIAKQRKDDKSINGKIVYENSLKDDVARELKISSNDSQFNEIYYSLLNEIVTSQMNRPKDTVN